VGACRWRRPGPGRRGGGIQTYLGPRTLAGSVTRWLWGASSALVAEDTAAQSLEADPLGFTHLCGRSGRDSRLAELAVSGGVGASVWRDARDPGGDIDTMIADLPHGVSCTRGRGCRAVAQAMARAAMG
jgi:hypothetical protein